MTDYRIIQGDALTVLRGMESESVQTCVTSPPYYGLRSYNTEPQVWDGDEFCDHVWADRIKPAANGLVNNVMQGKTLDGNSGTRSPSTYSVCQLCNAWRGELGLEPDFRLYISHLLQIFAEVKRVLKKDGTCFVNLGDSYASSPPGNTTKGVSGKSGLNGVNGTSGRYRETLEAGHATKRDTSSMGIRSKSLMNIPARFAIGMTDELQFIQRNEIIWYKRACMPSSAKDRFTVDFEPVFFFAKNPKYKFNQQVEPLAESTATDPRTVKGEWSTARPERGYNGQQQQATAMLKPTIVGRTAQGGDGSGELGNSVRFGHNTVGRNKRCVWDVPFEPQSDEHYASYPTKLVEPMILAGTDDGDTVLDLFAGTGTTLLTALRHRRNALGIELQPKYVDICNRRLREVNVCLF